MDQSVNGENIDQEEVILDWDPLDPVMSVPDPHREFWGDSREIEGIDVAVRPPVKPLAILEKLGPSPFERGSFPLIGFLATTFDKVSLFALERAGYQSSPESEIPPADIPNL